MSKVDQGEPQHRDTKEIVKFARELGVNLADSDWHIFEQFVDAAVRHAAASLPESQPAPEMDADALVRQFCPVLSYTCEADRQQQHKARVNLAEEWLRAHDARVQPSSVAGTMPVAVKKMRDACHADVLELIQRIIDTSTPGTPATLSMQSLHEALSEGIDGFGDDSYSDNKVESALKESSRGTKN